MNGVKPLHVLGKLQAAIFKVPVVGEKIVRGHSRMAALLAFRLPVLGGRRCSSLSDLRGEWLRFLGLSGVYPSIVNESQTEVTLELGACPYGFRTEREQGVCDACMDLDRTYVGLLGGGLEVAQSIPSGARACRFVVRFPV